MVFENILTQKLLKLTDKKGVRLQTGALRNNLVFL
jgi:hypothetical protein